MDIVSFFERLGNNFLNNPPLVGFLIGLLLVQSTIAWIWISVLQNRIADLSASIRILKR